MNFREVGARLSDSGFELAPGAERVVLQEYLSYTGSKPNLLSAMYRAFNGFLSQHFKSQIYIWPVKDFITHLELSTLVGTKRYFAFADILLDSDFFMIDPSDEDAPVFLRFDGEEVAPSTSVFFDKLATGKFDFTA